MPTPTVDLRRYPRFELLAQVELHRGDETLILPARNLSLGGILLGSDGNDLSHFEIGGSVDLQLFDARDETQPPLRALARVVRRAVDSLALSFVESDEVKRRLRELIATIQPRDVL